MDERRGGGSGCAVDGNEVMAKCHRPAGIVKRDRPRPSVTVIDVRHMVRMPVVVNDVARLKIVGVDRGHRQPPIRSIAAVHVHLECHHATGP